MESSGPRYHHGRLREALIEASLEIVRARGADALSLRAAARLAGVSHAAPAHHFGDRRGLLAAVAEVGYQRLQASMRRVEASAGPLDRLRAVGRGYVRFALAEPEHFRLMFHPSLADRTDLHALQEAARATFELLVDAVRACQQVELVREGDPHELAVTAWSAVHGASVLAMDQQLVANGIAVGDGLADALTRDIFLGLRRDALTAR